MCLILQRYWDVAVSIATSNSIFCLWVWIKSEVYQIKADTHEELLAGILDSVALIKKLEDQFRRATREIRTWDSKSVKVDGGIFENLYEL